VLRPRHHFQIRRPQDVRPHILAKDRFTNVMLFPEFPPRSASMLDLTAREGEFFMYRYISRESCSQFDSLPLTSLTIFLHLCSTSP
jgi:hypothetical protein